MADENKDLETLTDPAVTEAGDNENAQAEPAQEEASQLPFALGEDAQAGEMALEPTDAPAEMDPTTGPAADADLGTSESETPVAEGSSEMPAGDSLPAGDAGATELPTDEAPAATGTDAAAEVPNAAGASDADAPVADAPAEDLPTSTSTGIGGDKASEVSPPEAPKVDEAPAPSPAPSSPGLFDHGTPVKIPDVTVDVSGGYPVLDPEAPAAHPQHFGPLVGDGVGDDAGKVSEPPKYPTEAPVEVVKDEGGAEPAPKTDSFGDKAAEGAEDGSDVPAPAVIPPAFEGKFRHLTDKLNSIESKISQLLHELLD